MQLLALVGSLPLSRLLVPMLRELGATEADLKQLFRTNALQAYSIKPPPPRQ